MRYRILLIYLVALLVPRMTYAASSMVINEFQTTTPQIVELYNNGTEVVDLSGWHIDDSGGSTFFTIPDNVKLPAKKCISFEAGFSFNTASSDTVRLFNAHAEPGASNAQLIDSFTYDHIAEPAKNYQRIPDGSSVWVAGAPSVNSLNLDGAPCTPPVPTALPTGTPAPTKTPTPQPAQTANTGSPTSIGNIYISEFLANPATGQHEWVEFYNANDYAVSLENWYIDDVIDAGATPYRFSLYLPAQSYGVIELSGAMFNNSGDSVRLLNDNETQVDSLTYEAVAPDETINRNALTNTTICFAPPTKGWANEPCAGTSEAGGLVSPAPTASPMQPPITPVAIADHPLQSSSSAQKAAVAGGVSAGLPPSPAPTGEVYGASDGTTDTLGFRQLQPLIVGTVFVALLCALLTIGFVFFRMRLWYANSTTGSPHWS